MSSHDSRLASERAVSTLAWDKELRHSTMLFDASMVADRETVRLTWEMPSKDLLTLLSPMTRSIGPLLEPPVSESMFAGSNDRESDSILTMFSQMSPVLTRAVLSAL